MELTPTQRRISWALQIIAAVILLQSLFFKFSGAPESVAIFSKLGVEPWGRIGLGVVELITAILLLVPRTASVGALLAAGITAGAIGSHLTVLGIESEGDGGALFGLAVAVFVSGLIVLFLRRRQIPVLGKAVFR
jgi:putative oxidoreductase